jgi:hypothetical protein
VIIGFTGSRSGMTDFQKHELKLILGNGCDEFMHGDCKGSDEQANTVALSMGVKMFTIHPPSQHKYRAFCFDMHHTTQINNILTPYITTKDGIQVRWYPVDDFLKRNKRIVDMCDVIIATPKEFRHTIRSGTWATIRYAWKTKKDSIIIIPPVNRMDINPTEINTEINSTQEIKDPS